jgi:hypothetical protein
VKFTLCCAPSWSRRLQFQLQAGQCLYIEAVFLNTSPALGWIWSPFIFLEGAIWGLWIAGYAKYSPDLWGQLCRVSASYAWRGVGFLLLKVVCSGNIYDGNVGYGSLRTSFWGTQWGQLNRSLALLSPLASIEWRFGALRRLLAWYNSLLSGGCLGVSASWLRIVTWLILPVVICLSQRLSHACLSISNYTVKLRMAH